ncbi:SDR family oxidoreductase [uncultured Arcanobacterium sp.]|uniref:SDR family NAD(P)-dependent oxidoreductase n=1 Tax=uncultured Arcanobacterium sp. TaxID=487520 RepID=UPI00260C85CC|nr:SDR family NAD(P)-dependent oxidoreductase [uncultured Arcanobacterium sp.]
MSLALVTGASSGLGKEFVQLLAAEGSNLVIVARNEKNLRDLAAEMEQRFRVQVEVLPADLTMADEVEKVALRLQDTENPVDLLINNAGMGLGQEFVGGSIAQELTAVNLMVNALLVLTHAAVGAMVARGSGQIINVSSITSMTVQGTYSAHKAWVKVFTEGLADDLAGTGVNITAVMPGLMHTEFHQRVHVDAGQWAEWMFIKPRKVARAALDGVRAGKVLVIPSVLYKATYVALKFAPRVLVRKYAGSKRSGRL